jgi:hypothetical protein
MRIRCDNNPTRFGGYSIGLPLWTVGSRVDAVFHIDGLYVGGGGLKGTVEKGWLVRRDDQLDQGVRPASRIYAVARMRSAPARSTETSCDTPRSAMVTPNSRSMRAMVMR